MAVHPFILENSRQQTSEQVEKTLREQSLEFKKIAENHVIADSKDSLGKFIRQIKDVASIVDVWRVWAEESLAIYELEPELRNWLLSSLLPVIYWHKQLNKTQNPNLKIAYKKAMEQALATWRPHPLTQSLSSDEIERWRFWAEWISDKFQRTSSAVEGRNGWLSQMYHNGRGMTVQRLKALTVMHNFDLRRSDGTTAAERLLKRNFQDPFEWVVSRMGPLPNGQKSERTGDF